MTVILTIAGVLTAMVMAPRPAAAAGIPPLLSAAPSCHPYPDVDASNSACENIAWLKTMGVTKPADGLYHPRASVSRGSMTAFLFRLMHPGQPSPRCTARPFPDVPVHSTFCGYISWAKKAHIVYGYANGHYGASRPVTRGAMAAYLYRMAESTAPPPCTTKPFDDVAVPSTFCGVIAWMKTTGITYGVGGGRYGTGLPVTRQAMASFLHRAVDLGYLGIPAPALSLAAVDDQVAAGSAPRFTYSAAHVPTPARVDLQVKDLSDPTPGWTSVQAVSPGSGTINGPTVSGWQQRDYRLRVIDDGTVLGTSAPVAITVYGRIPLKTVCTLTDDTYIGCPSLGTVQVGDHQFRYAGFMQSWAYDTTSWEGVMTAYLRTCRSITLRFAVESSWTDLSNLQELRVWSETHHRWFSATTHRGRVGSLTVPVDYRGFTIEARSDPQGSVDPNIYLNGWASCSTKDGS